MVDNTTLNAGAGGDVIATDDIAGIKHQLVKVEFGVDGVATPVAAGTPLPVDGSGVTQPVSAAALPLPAGAATSANQLPNGHDVTVDNAAGAAAVNVQDGGNSLTVDAASLPLPAGASTSALQLPDGHNVTVDNGAAGAAVNVQDGGNILTVDGTVTAAQATAANLNAEVQGDAAHDAPVAGNPVLIGGEARTTNPTSVADGDAVRMQMDKAGRVVVVPGGVRERVIDTLINLQAGTETTIFAAQGAGIFADLTALIITNGTATPVAVSIRSATAGSVRSVINIAARGGAVIVFSVPFKQTAANNAWTAQLSAVLAAPGLDITAQAVTNL